MIESEDGVPSTTLTAILVAFARCVPRHRSLARPSCSRFGNEERGPCRRTTRSPARTRSPLPPATPATWRPRRLEDPEREQGRGADRRAHARRVELCGPARLDSLVGKKPALIEWQVFPSMQPNPQFVDDACRARSRTRRRRCCFCVEVELRSAAAAKAMTAAGYSTCLNVADGFEGPLDAQGKRGSAGGMEGGGTSVETNVNRNSDDFDVGQQQERGA